MPVKILTIGDPHFKSTNVKQTNELTSKISKIIRQNEDLDAVVVLGDTLDRHDKVDLFPLHRSVSFFKEIRRSLDYIENKTNSFEKQLWILIGNHDRPNNTTFLTDEHPFTSVKEWRNTIVADEVLIESICHKEKEFLVCLVPYVPVGRFNEAMGGECDWWKHIVDFDQGEQIGCVFAHQEFKGCKLTEKVISGCKDIYPKKAPLCISGHIHTRNSPQLNLIYPGTPFSHDFSDSDKEYGVSIFTFFDDDSDDGYNKKVEEQFINLDISKKILVNICSSDELENLLKKSIVNQTKLTTELIKLKGFDQNKVSEIKIQLNIDDEEFKTKIKSLTVGNALASENISIVNKKREGKKANYEIAKRYVSFYHQLKSRLPNLDEDVSKFLSDTFDLY